MSQSEAKIWVCRDIPGEHCGGQDCFCLPVEVDPWDDQWEEKLELAMKGN